MKEKRQYDSLFPLLLLCMFIISGSLLMGYMAVDTQQIKQTSDEQENLIIALSYIKNKVLQTPGMIQVQQEPQSDYLVLHEEQQGIMYQTYIYVYENSLRELYLQEGVPVQPEDGTIITDMKRITLSVTEHLLQVSLTDNNGQQNTMQIYITERQ